jgi:hypothetical protein
VVITVESDLESALRNAAKKQGIAPETLALSALRERFLIPVVRVEPRDEWERQLLAAASDCGISLPNEALSSDGLYEEWPIHKRIG